MNANYVSYLEADKKSERTIKEYTKYVGQCLKFIGKPEADVTFSDLTNWKNSISHLSAASMGIQISAVRSYFSFLLKIKSVKENPALELSKPQIKNKEKPFCSVETIKALIDNAYSSRDRAIIATVASTGLRMSEMASITMEQYNRMNQYGVRDIVICGKGDKERTVYINDMAKAAIDEYVVKRKTSNADRLFESYRGNVINDGNLNRMLKNTARKANLPFWKEMSCHVLRAAFATNNAIAGTPMPVIRDMLGHSSLSTTSRYCKTNNAEIQKYMMKGF